VTVLTSPDLRREVVLAPPRPPRLSLSRSVRFTKRFTEPVVDLWVHCPSTGATAHTPACRFIQSTYLSHTTADFSVSPFPSWSPEVPAGGIQHRNGSPRADPAAPSVERSIAEAFQVTRVAPGGRRCESHRGGYR